MARTQQILCADNVIRSGESLRKYLDAKQAEAVAAIKREGFEAGFRAGIEAAAKLSEGDAFRSVRGMTWDVGCDLADLIREISVPQGE